VRRPGDVDPMTYEEKERDGLLAESEERRVRLIREGWLPDGVGRVGGWEEAVRWIERSERSSFSYAV